ncbi:MBL fold metallo-hydrolase [Dickeya dianthicola]|uniref:MBL fold metallo-hydrolase n=1 Tax=Dickeya dianthicola TaxID=204039 RepID=UPI00301A3B0F
MTKSSIFNDHGYIRREELSRLFVGYSAANVTLIQGKEGSIIVDTPANPSDTSSIIEAFGSQLNHPIRAIIYTHNHPDHSR